MQARLPTTDDRTLEHSRMINHKPAMSWNLRWVWWKICFTNAFYMEVLIIFYMSHCFPCLGYLQQTPLEGNTFEKWEPQILIQLTFKTCNLWSEVCQRLAVLQPQIVHWIYARKMRASSVLTYCPALLSFSLSYSP